MLVIEEYNGQICLTPKSILIIDKPLNYDGSRNKKITGINLNHDGIYEYKYYRTIKVKKMKGSKYESKGNK